MNVKIITENKLRELISEYKNFDFGYWYKLNNKLYILKSPKLPKKKYKDNKIKI